MDKGARSPKMSQRLPRFSFRGLKRFFGIRSLTQNGPKSVEKFSAPFPSARTKHHSTQGGCL